VYHILLVVGMRACSLFGCTNRLHYGSCPSVRLSVRLSRIGS